jgi:hypothetical protein
MSELVLTTNTLPEPLIRLIHTEKIRVDKTNGIVSLTPIEDSSNDCPLLGLAADSRLTVDSFLSMTHDELEIGA